MDRLEGRVGVVTGSASGLGRAMVERFAQEGMTVVVADNRLAAAQVSVLCPSHHENTGIYENSALYRPEAYGGPMTSEEIVATAHPSQGSANASASKVVISTPKDPGECAERVLRAIREGHFYIFTHRENRKVIEHRFAQIRAGLDDAATFTPSSGS